MKLLYQGTLWRGGTALQRAEAFDALSNVTMIPLDVTDRTSAGSGFYRRIRWKIGFPVDHQKENSKTIDAVRNSKPDIVVVDNSKVITGKTIDIVRGICDPVIVYYSPDDIMVSHNFKAAVRGALPFWDIIFTTKTYNIEELRSAGGRDPVLVGNAFDPVVHRPMSAVEVGADYERFDLVFIGTFEPERASSLLALAKAGMSVLVHGIDAGMFAGRWGVEHPNITLRPPAFADDYARCMHHGKIALCFLRKINRDRITTRSIEIPAMARPMLAEKTDEHDAHFDDGAEYVGFVDDDDLVRKARGLLADEGRRKRLAAAGYRRCLQSGYGVGARAEQMMGHIERRRLSRG